jgi:hypothetical protein
MALIAAVNGPWSTTRPKSRIEDPEMRAVELAALSLLASFRAYGSPDLLTDARAAFAEGDYRQAALAADRVLGLPLKEAQARLEADRIAGLSHFYLGERDMARVRLLDLFTTEPAYTIDPVSVAPEVASFVKAVREESVSLSRAIQREERDRVEGRSLEPSGGEAGGPQTVVDLKVRNEPHKMLLLTLLPFGAGQFQERSFVLGGILGTAQLVGLALSVYSYVEFRSVLVCQGIGVQTVNGDNISSAVMWRDLNWASLGLLVLGYGASVAEAIVHFDAQSESHASLSVGGSGVSLALRF